PNPASTNLAGTFTNWPSPPTRPVGTNQFFITYQTNNFGGVTFSTPLENGSTPVSSWTASASLISGAGSMFVVGSAAVPVQILNPHTGGGGLQFSFMSQSGHPHFIEANTNLAVTNGWITLSNFVGDGTLKNFTFTTTNPRVRFFRVKTQ